MPRIEDKLLDCVFYLYPTVQAATQGIAAGGTGFLVGVRSGIVDDMWFLYAVTNSHVIEEAAAMVVRLNTQRGGVAFLETEPGDWTHHPEGDDIAIAPIGLDPELEKFIFISTKVFITREMIAAYDIGAGDDVFMVGRFINHEGRQKNLPAVRFGNISIMPIEPMNHPRGTAYESFAVEMRSIGGFSGSPVFVSISTLEGRPNSRMLKDAAITGTNRITRLLGIDWGHITDRYSVEVEDERTGQFTTPVEERLVPHGKRLVARANTNMAGVVPAWKLTELLNMEQVVGYRKELERQVRDQREPKTGGQSEIDIAKNDLRSEEESFITREDFGKAVRKVSEPKENPPDEEMS